MVRHHIWNEDAYLELSSDKSDLYEFLFFNLNSSRFATYEPRYSVLIMTLVCLVLGVMIVFTIMGNVFVMVTIVTELSIKNSSNHLIFSLASTDLLVATTVMPLSAINEVSLQWWLGLKLCDMWIFLDVLTCTASIFHLVVIGLDRYLSITRLAYSRQRSLTSTSLMVGFAWLAAILVSIPSRFHLERSSKFQRFKVNYNGTCVINDGHSYTITANLMSFGLPILLVGLIYLKIFMFIRQQTINRKEIKNSVIGSEALSTVMNMESVAYSKESPSSQYPSNTWSSPQPYRRHDDASQVSSYLDKVSLSFHYADSGDESDDITTNRELDFNLDYVNSPFQLSPSANSLSTNYSYTFLSLKLHTPSSIATNNNLAKSESLESIISSNKMIPTRTQSCLKSPTSIIKYSSSDVKHPSSLQYNHYKVRSPVLSWSPKLTFYHENSGSNHRPNRLSNTQTKSYYENSEDLSSNEANIKVQTNTNHSYLNDEVSIDNSKCQNSLKIHNDPSTNDIARSYSNSNNSTNMSNSNTNQELRQALNNRIKRNLNNRREYKVARTLFIITGLFLVCWLPFGLNNLIRYYTDESTSEVRRFFDSFFLWLGYANSGLNPLIYTIFSPDFRAAFKKILFGSRKYYI